MILGAAKWGVFYCPGAYDLTLYCKYENPDHPYGWLPVTIISPSRKACLAAARAKGWRIHRDHSATCPFCVADLASLGET